MADTRDLIVRIKGDTSDFEKSIGNITGKSEEANTSFGKLAGAVAAGQAIFAAAQQVIAGVGDAIDFVKGTLDAVTELGIQVRKLTQETGANAQTASEWLAVFDRFGITGDQAAVAIKTFAKQVEAANSLNGAAASGFGKLGINVKDSTGKTKDFNELLLEVADKFQQLGPGLDRTATSVQLFGRQGQNLLPLLNNGRQGILELEDEAKRMGLVLDDQNAGAIADYIKKQAEMKEAVSGFKLQIGLGLMPIVTQMIGKMLDWVNANGGMQKIVQDRIIPVIKDLIKWVKENKQSFIDIINAVIDFGKFIGDVFAAVIAVFNFFHVTVAGVIYDVINFFQNLAKTIKNFIDSVVGWFKELPGHIADAFGKLVEIIVYPFKTAFNLVAKLWDDTIGKISFKAPDWVPGIGGKGWSMPQIPQLAQGAIIQSKPGGTLVNVGEAGQDEAVVPLNKMGSMGGVNITVNMGMYAGMPVEKREIALSLYKELVRAARAQGVNMPMIGAVGVQ